MLIDEIKVLNDTLYKALGELKENSTHINEPEHLKEIENNIFDLYNLDFKIIRGCFKDQDKLAGDIEIEQLVRKNEFERRKKELTPKRKRRWFAPWTFKTNRSEDLIERESAANSDIFLDRKENAVEQLEKMLEAADNEGTEALKPTTRRERREQRRQERRERKDRERSEKEMRKSRKQQETSEKTNKPGE